MSKIEDAINRLSFLECPTGELENRIVEILNDYDITNASVKRTEELDRNGAQAYSVKISDENMQNIIVIADSGLDDYVAKVIAAYIH